MNAIQFGFRKLLANALLFINMAIPAFLFAQTSITIYSRGVFETNISLLALSENQTYRSIEDAYGITEGQACTLYIPQHYLPGEFVLRFDHKESERSTPYPSEKFLFISNQDLTLHVHPIYANDPDSSYFQEGETENSAYWAFSGENSIKREKLDLLSHFLMNYDDVDSKFYRQGVREYQKRRKDYNEWITDRATKDASLFVSSLYRFNYLPELAWVGTEEDRLVGLIGSYFEGIDWNDSLIIRTNRMNSWMNRYVSLYGQMATTVELRDSLFSEAAGMAIENAKLGHPVVYGWMVDYFFRGFEANDIAVGFQLLEPYMEDPDCLTSKRREINRRLKGMETLANGAIAPDFTFIDGSGRTQSLHDEDTGTDCKLVLFWSAGCGHCMELVDHLFEWYNFPGNNHKLKIYAISLDETEPEVEAWNEYKSRLPGWHHILAKGGVNSQIANDYFILSTPVMVLVDAQSNTILTLPETVDQLNDSLP